MYHNNFLRKQSVIELSTRVQFDTLLESGIATTIRMQLFLFKIYQHRAEIVIRCFGLQI